MMSQKIKEIKGNHVKSQKSTEINRNHLKSCEIKEIIEITRNQGNHQKSRKSPETKKSEVSFFPLDFDIILSHPVFCRYYENKFSVKILSLKQHTDIVSKFFALKFVVYYSDIASLIYD